ncbi:MAG: cation:proton antiporter [Bacilli bacterium]
MQGIMFIGIIVAFGAILGHAMSKIKLPSIAGYIIAGVIVGPSVLNLIPTDVVEGLYPLTDIALAFLAFSVGTELFIPKLKKSGVALVAIAAFEVVFTCLVVTLAMYLLGMNIFIALLLGALASSTSPAPILMIKKQFKLKNNIVDDSIAICALDDAIGIVVFGIAKVFVEKGYHSEAKLHILDLLEPAIIELSISVFFGIVIGIGLGFLINTFAKKKNDDDLGFFLETTFVSVILSLSFAYLFNGSTVLLPLVAGLAFTNVVDKQVFSLESKVVDLFALPFLIAFFTIAGIQINLGAISSVWYIGIVYVIVRTLGKYFGGKIGGKLTHHKKKYNRQIGLSLLPLGGVEIGLALSAQAVLPESEGNEVKLIVLTGTLVFSVLGTYVVSNSLKNGVCTEES